MAAERYLSRRIPDLRVGNNIDILSYQGLRLSKGRYDETFAGEDVILMK